MAPSRGLSYDASSHVSTLCDLFPDLNHDLAFKFLGEHDWNLEETCDAALDAMSQGLQPLSLCLSHLSGSAAIAPCPSNRPEPAWKPSLWSRDGSYPARPCSRSSLALVSNLSSSCTDWEDLPADSGIQSKGIQPDVRISSDNPQSSPYLSADEADTTIDTCTWDPAGNNFVHKETNAIRGLTSLLLHSSWGQTPSWSWFLGRCK